MFSVIFDMDGTLLDTQKICVPAWEYAGRNQGIEGMGEFVPNLCGMNETGWSAYAIEHTTGLDLERFKREMRAYIIENQTVRFKKGAKELLDFLKSHNIKVALATGSSPATVAHHLNAVGAYSCFDAFAAGLEVKNGKPEPDIFLLAAKRLGAKPSDCFVFEDSPLGIIAAHKANMKGIGVPDIAVFSDEVKQKMFACIDDLSEAIPIFEKLL